MCTRWNSKHKSNLKFEVDLTTCLSSGFDAESKAIIFRNWKIQWNKKMCTFWKRFVFWRKRHLQNISYFSTRRKHLLRLKCRFSWSAAHALSTSVINAKKIFTRILHCLRLTNDANQNYFEPTLLIEIKNLIVMMLKSDVNQDSIWPNYIVIRRLLS